MKTYVLLHFEHKNDVTIIIKLLVRATSRTNAAKTVAVFDNISQVIKLKKHLWQYLSVLQ